MPIWINYVNEAWLTLVSLSHETRIYCGFRKNMIQVANSPSDEVTLEWPICLHLESLIQDVIFLRLDLHFLLLSSIPKN